MPLAEHPAPSANAESPVAPTLGPGPLRMSHWALQLAGNFLGASEGSENPQSKLEGQRTIQKGWTRFLLLVLSGKWKSTMGLLGSTRWSASTSMGFEIPDCCRERPRWLNQAQRPRRDLLFPKQGARACDSCIVEAPRSFFQQHGWTW